MSVSYDPELRKVTVRDEVTFPQAVLEHAGEVEILDMSDNQLTALPNLSRLKSLRVAFFSNNPFEAVPTGAFAACEKLELLGMRSCNIRGFDDAPLPKSLRGLILTDNKVTELPKSIGSCINLQKLMMTGNQLTDLPKELINCRSLEIVRFAVNKLAVTPEWLFELPRLAWYADSSNPYSLPLASRPPEVAWRDITVGPELGHSVNNVVYYGRLADGREVALKQFGHDLVTDGLPADDMNTCLAAGDHPNVVGGIGKVVDAPDEYERLVMPLISSDFKVLGNPPSLSTICRDVYPSDQVFSAEFVIRVLQTVAAGMEHLHRTGVMHGDLYAHNILTNQGGESCVGDFGGASLYMPDSDMGTLRERIDVLAFGRLAEELIARISPAATDTVALGLQSLRDSCLDETIRKRPTFTEISSFLAS
jgi:serine/threonine protein kinase